MTAVPVLAVSAFAAVTFAVGAAFALFALGVVVHAVRERRWVEELAHRGVDAEARVERLKAHTAAGSDVRDGARRWRYRAVVSFRDGAGHERMATTRWPSSTAPRVGDVIRVRYDPERPKRVVAAEGPGSAVPPTWGYVALAGVTLVFAWVAVTVGRTVG
jgi:hypothetical protein